MIGSIAREESIPLKFLEAILLDLKSHGLLESKLGRKGGYRLSRPPSSMTVGSIIRMMEGPLAPIPCASETAYRPCAECKDIEGCGTRIIMREVRDAISDVLDRTTLADLLRNVESSRPARDSAELAQYEI